jgi:hemerythrin
MALLEWTDKMSVGIETIDADHKKLLALVNELHAVVRKKESPQAVGRVLRDLIAYTDYHFQAEEQLLRLLRFPDLERHKEVHDQLRKKVADLEARYGDCPEIASVKICVFLSEWRVRDIVGEGMG